MSMGSDHSKVVKKVLKKNIFVFLGNPLNRDKIFEIFFYQWIAFIHTKTLIPHWSSLDMCVRHSSASKSKSVKIGIPSKPPPPLNAGNAPETWEDQTITLNAIYVIEFFIAIVQQLTAVYITVIFVLMIYFLFKRWMMTTFQTFSI